MRVLIVSSALSILSFVAASAEPVADLPPQEMSAPFRDAQMGSTQTQAQKLMEQTKAYFAAKDEARFEDAYAFFSESQKRTVPFDGWRAQLENFYREAGAVQSRTVRKITWYKDPPNAQPGIYVAVDFSGNFPHLTLYCGFVAWRQKADGAFEVVREEANSITSSVAEKMSPDMMQNARRMFRC